MPGCRAVHTFGLAQAIDLVFVDAGGRIVRQAPQVPPGRWAGCRQAWAVLELPAGYLARADARAQAEAAIRARKIVV